MSKILVAFEWDCGRQGKLRGHFVTTKDELETIYGKHVYFGEVLGKHSEIYGDIKEEDFIITLDSSTNLQDAEFIARFENLFGSIGYNPFDYLPEE